MGVHHECGVLGIYGVQDAARLAYYALHSLQHRGQQSCGIVTFDSGEMHIMKGQGLVNEVFNQQNLTTLTGNIAIGHVRYPTTNVGGIENVQPFSFRHHTGDFALAHNGNIVNFNEIRRYQEQRGSLFQTTSDSELFAHLIKKNYSDDHRIHNILDALDRTGLYQRQKTYSYNCF